MARYTYDDTLFARVLLSNSSFGTPAALPAAYRGLHLSTLADMTGIVAAESGYGYWPMVETRAELASYQEHGAPTDTADAEAKRIVRNYPAVTRSIEDVRAEKLAALADERWQREVGGYTVSGITVLTDDRSKLMLTGAYNSALADAGWSTEWKVAPGSFVTIDAATAIGLSNAVAAYVAALFAQEAAHSAAIVELETAAEVAAYDITADWPAASI